MSQIGLVTSCQHIWLSQKTKQSKLGWFQIDKTEFYYFRMCFCNLTKV